MLEYILLLFLFISFVIEGKTANYEVDITVGRELPYKKIKQYIYLNWIKAVLYIIEAILFVFIAVA